jgi:hypothetical protein
MNEQGVVVIDPSNAPVPTCSVHVSQPLNLFCRDDLATICGVCSVSSLHKGHDVCSVEEAHEEWKLKLVDQQNKLVEGSDKATLTMQVITSSIEQLLSSTKTSAQQIKDTAQALREAVDHAEQNALNMLNKSHAIIQQEAESKARTAHIFLTDATQLVRSIDDLVTTSTAHVLLAQAPSLDRQAKEILLSLPPVDGVSSITHQAVHVVFSQDLKERACAAIRAVTLIDGTSYAWKSL